MRNPLPVLVLLCACEGQITVPVPSPGSTDPTDPTIPGTVDPTKPPARLDCTSARHPATSAMRRLTRDEYARAVTDLFEGKVAPSAQFPQSAPVTSSSTGYSTEPALSLVSDQGAEQLMLAAEDVAVALPAQLNALLPCAASTANEACAGTFIDRFGRRAYRRPPSADERAALLTAYRDARTAGFTFPEAIAATTVLMLQSPRFLYVVETAAADLRALDGWELASRLSFLFWGSGPDDALLDAAAAGSLDTPAGLSAQAARLLASSRADSAAARLFREWLQAPEVTPSQKDQALFPQMTAAMTASMNGSLDRFAADQLRSGTVQSLLTSDAAFVDANVASFFSVTAPAPGQWQRVALGAGPRKGIVTQPAVMAALAHSNEASYVFRGRMMHKRLLCQPLGAPPASAMAEFGAITLPPDPTAKEVSQAVQSRSAACAGCHKLIDPAGLALEPFDAIGRRRAQYGSGKAIDGSGVLGAGSTAIAFADHGALLDALAADARVPRCFAQQAFRFTLSRLETEADACALQAMGDALEQSGGRLDSALFALVTSDSFRFRKD